MSDRGAEANAAALLRRRLRDSRHVRQPLSIGLAAALVIWTTATVWMLATARISLRDAILMIPVPWALLMAAFRPDWLLLVLVALPANLTVAVPLSRVLALIVVALGAVIVTRGRFFPGLGTGLAALVLIAVAGFLVQADVGKDALTISHSITLLVVYYTALALLAFNLTLLGELDGRHLGVAFLVGVGATLAVGLAGYESGWFPAGVAILSRSYLGYLAAGALGVSLAMAMNESARRRHPVAIVFACAGTLVLTIASFGRAVWVAAAATFIILVLQRGRRRFLLLAILAIALMLRLPETRQELASSESGDIVAAFKTGEITTGRWELWTELWDRSWVALPWGNGFGFMWSLSSQDLFGSPGIFTGSEEGSVFPHNDFLFLFVEFGIPGVALVLLFWFSLLKAYVRVARNSDPTVRRQGEVLLGILLTGLMIALVDNLFALRPFAERFFPAAGVVLALGHAGVMLTRSQESRRHLTHQVGRSAFASQVLMILRQRTAEL